MMLVASFFEPRRPTMVRVQLTWLWAVATCFVEIAVAHADLPTRVVEVGLIAACNLFEPEVEVVTDDRTSIYDVEVLAVENAQVPARFESPRVIPEPKSVEFGDRAPILPASRVDQVLADALANIHTPPVPMVQPAISELKRAWSLTSAHHGVRGSAHPTSAKSKSSSSRLILRGASIGETIKPEGYHLEVTTDQITLVANDKAGFLHAAQTLKQLTTPLANGDLSIRACAIRDWPSLAFRGVHLFTGGKGDDLHRRLIRDVITATKFNHLVLEAEYVRWDSHPEIHHAEFGMPKDQVRSLIELCRTLGIEVGPLVQSLGHCQWIFANGQNLDICEDPEARWAYCVTNPRTYKFIFSIYEEMLELFKPRFVHIGHDEFTDRGRAPFQPESKKHSIEDLFMMDTLRLHEWFAARDVSVMMWGDMLLAKGEAPDACHAKSREAAENLRARLPDDVIITDWHYTDDPPNEFTSLNTFRDAGNRTIAATWYRPDNIRNFARAAFDQHALGLLQTTWAGYSLDSDSFAHELHQYQAYVLAAEAAWNADRPVTMDITDAGLQFNRMMGLDRLGDRWRRGWVADLSHVGNYPLAAKDDDGWFELGPERDLSALPVGQRRLGGLMVQIGSDERPIAVVLGGRLSKAEKLYDELTLNIEKDVQTLVMVAATESTCAADTKIARVRATFVDGQSQTLELVYGRNVFAYTDLAPATDASVVWRGKNRRGENVGVRAIVWPLGDGNRMLQSLTFQNSDSQTSLILVGLTGLLEF